MVTDLNHFLQECSRTASDAGKELQAFCEEWLLPLLQGSVTPGGEVGKLQTLYEFAHRVAASSHTPLRTLLTHPGANTHVYGRQVEDDAFEIDRPNRRLFKNIIGWFGAPTPEASTVLPESSDTPDLQNTRTQQFSALWALEAAGDELSTSLVASACSHCFAEISIISRPAAALGAEGMHAMLDDKSGVSTQFASLVSHYINFTRRAAGVRGEQVPARSLALFARCVCRRVRS